MPYQLIYTEHLNQLSDADLQQKIQELTAELDVFSAERYDDMCQQLIDMKALASMRKEKDQKEWYLIASPRYESRGTRLYGPSTLAYCQMALRKLVLAEGFQIDDLEDNYAHDTDETCFEITTLQPLWEIE